MKDMEMMKKMMADEMKKMHSDDSFPAIKEMMKKKGMPKLGMKPMMPMPGKKM